MVKSGGLPSQGSHRVGHDWSALAAAAVAVADSVLKSRDITLPTKVHIVKTMLFPVVMYGYGSRTLKKAECWPLLSNCGVGEDSWQSLGLQGDQTSLSYRKSTLNIHQKDWCWAEAPILWPPDAKSWLIGKDPDAGKDWRQKEKGMAEDKMVR